MSDTSKRWVEYVRLDELHPADRNPKGHDEQGIARSIDHHGVGELPLLDERTGKLVAGHGRRDDLIRKHTAGAPAPGGVEVDAADGMWLMPVVRGWASRDAADAEAYLLGSNKLAINGAWADTRQLAEMLEQLADEQLHEIAGWSALEIDDLLAEMQELPPNPDLPNPHTPAPAGGGGVGGGGGLDGNTRVNRGLGELAPDYAAANTRVVVLSYTGPRYVWVVEQLTALMADRGLESNAEVVLALLQDVTGATAPPAPTAAQPAATDG